MAARERLICAAGMLLDGGPGVRFERRSPAGHLEGGFVIRQHGKVRGFVNRCPHAGTELDWNPGEFFDEGAVYLICSTHGALFEPSTGNCVAGPCRGASLQPLEIGERDGQVYLLNDPEIDQPSSP